MTTQDGYPGEGPERRFPGRPPRDHGDAEQLVEMAGEPDPEEPRTTPVDEPVELPPS
jgi:hypothetical protein